MTESHTQGTDPDVSFASKARDLTPNRIARHVTVASPSALNRAQRDALLNAQRTRGWDERTSKAVERFALSATAGAARDRLVTPENWLDVHARWVAAGRPR